MDTTSRNILIIFLFVLVIYILATLSSILLPLVLAFLIASLFQPIIMFLKKRKLPNWLILPTVSIITLAILFGVGVIIAESASQIIAQKEFLLERLYIKLQDTFGFINEITGMTLSTDLFRDGGKNIFDNNWISGLATGFAQDLGSFTGAFLMFSLYYVILLAGMSEYKNYFRYVGGEERGDQFVTNYEMVQRSIYQYMTVKTLISIATGMLAFAITTAFGIKFAIFWAFLTFLLNYIPSIGSTIATLGPIVMAFIQFDSFEPIFFLAVSLTTVQMVMGNLVEPIIMGNRLRLNTLTVIFGLVFWGYIWGVTGMILSVPLLVILKIILERFPEFSIFARIMGYPIKTK
ncbi:MAG: AI-2E family transporter [Candidatus Kapaibacterium sp.]